MHHRPHEPVTLLRGLGRGHVRVPGTRHLRSSVTSLFARATRKPVLPLAAVALTAAVAGGVAWSATGKTVTLTVDGEAREVDFRGSTAADVLAAAGLDAGKRDSLVPAASSEVADGDTVALRRAREVQLVVDGAPRTVWVTADSVDEALTQVGLRDRGLALSASRSRDIPLDGMQLAVSTPKTVNIVAGGRTLTRTTTAPNVGVALQQAGVAVDGDDRVTHPDSQRVLDGLTVKVVKVSKDRVHEGVTLPFGTERREDAALLEGTTKVVAAGSPGRVRRTVERTFADGRLEGRALVKSETLAAPATRVVVVGTKPAPVAPAPSRSSSSASSSRSGSSSSGGGAPSGGFAALAQCESGGNPRATNPSGKYRGLYQFSRETWAGVGGTGDPAAASAAEQTKRAQMLIERSGAGQWPECGRYLR